VIPEVLELLVEQPKALLRDLVGLGVIDADLQEVEPGPVQCLNPAGHEEVSVRDEAGHHAARADVANQVVEIRVEHRLAAAERNRIAGSANRSCAASSPRSAPALTLSYSLQCRSRCCSAGWG
jgi:hypothetical protein